MGIAKQRQHVLMTVRASSVHGMSSKKKTLCCFICSTAAYIDTVVDCFITCEIARKGMKFSILMFFSACHKHVQNFVVLDVSCGVTTVEAPSIGREISMALSDQFPGPSV